MSEAMAERAVVIGELGIGALPPVPGTATQRDHAVATILRGVADLIES